MLSLDEQADEGERADEMACVHPDFRRPISAGLKFDKISPTDKS